MLKPGGYSLHWMRWCPKNEERLSITNPLQRADAPKRSRRGRREAVVPNVFDQIPQHPGGAWAYYLKDESVLRPEQRTWPATINEVLTIYPNGGSPGSRRFGNNAEYYHARQLKRGWRYVGSSLSKDAVERMVRIIAENREDYALFLREQVVQIDVDLDEGSGLNAAERDLQRRRRAQIEGQLRLVDQPLDAADLSRQLDDIAEAQQLAGAFTRTQLDVLKGMIGTTVGAMAATIADGRMPEVSDSQEPIKSNAIDLT